jgi:hypothetical protein
MEKMKLFGSAGKKIDFELEIKNCNRTWESLSIKDPRWICEVHVVQHGKAETCNAPVKDG